ncbi:MAG: hypothetical protein CGU28_04800 [Candidatus Dactylopiibacterium carminicum]|uniref:DUF1992 domain-containing protein n=1 Tax=Candidatus Dactylopiibacterium carminicum TaxID=857335 RepID=A0A272EU78_9RHOO|nr:DnaJ family domain-containing protein [Candidatus Dactylopiibacterium carminicum]KAF7599717.1 DUF1992 domain-containing protein [Candidatus Dactylopiibacterium carminicum]PAS93653.1 MAG: hypothetical protein CGU29_06870 [Candidatus Dactylopiibacterium carminicum]PAS97521.1 MAG: hypothetical protein CGU28_04800 [Candidatus Dactylopiibacterium carminicum]PAS99718.1 MAG: hypothetical protein BSR46_06465 [Candidatus Dactylopiibacterium carminicum]
MLLLDLLAEQNIERALAEGVFEHLEGAGRPLPDEDLSFVPADQRAAYRVLRNSGYLPPELEKHREAVALASQLTSLASTDAGRASLLARLTRINLWLAEAGKPQLAILPEYLDALARKP